MGSAIFMALVTVICLMFTVNALSHAAWILALQCGVLTIISLVLFALSVKRLATPKD